MRRHEDALGIQEGACNLRAIARSLVGAADEAAREGVGAEQDAAVRMIVHRLARLCRVDLVSYGYDPQSLSDTFCTLMQECRAKAGEGRKEPASPVGLESAVVMLQAAGLTEVPESIEG
jgi:hypothetical protein